MLPAPVTAVVTPLTEATGRTRDGAVVPAEQEA